VIGTGTHWLQFVQAGDVFAVTGETAGTVFQVIDDVTIDLVAPLVNTASGVSYTSKMLVDWTTIFKIGDELVLAGSLKGYSGRYPITSVSANSLTITGVFATSESRLFCASPKNRLLALARGVLLFPGGYESDTALRTQLAAAPVTHQQRGSTAGLTSDLTKVANFAPALIDSVNPGTLLQSAVASTSGGATLTVSAWAAGLTVGKSFLVSASTLGSNGRYWVYTNSGTDITPARRPVHTYEYYPYQASGIELQFREDRVNDRIYFRVNNPGGVASKTIAMSLTASGVGSVTAGVPVGAGYTVGVAGNVASFTWTLSPGELFREGWVNVGSLSAAIEFIPTVSESSTGLAIQAVRLGYGGINSRTLTGAISLTLARWRWGGLVKTALLAGTAETGLKVYNGATHGFYLGAGYPGILENDAYPMASPKDFLVVEVDNRNGTNYSNDDIKDTTRDYLIPADTDYLLEFV
jgi:hypothetical protein